MWRLARQILKSSADGSIVSPDTDQNNKDSKDFSSSSVDIETKSMLENPEICLPKAHLNTIHMHEISLDSEKPYNSCGLANLHLTENMESSTDDESKSLSKTFAK